MPLTWPPGNPLRVFQKVRRYCDKARSGSRARLKIGRPSCRMRSVAHSHNTRQLRELARPARCSGQILELLNDDLGLVRERHLGIVEAAQMHANTFVAGSRDAG